MDNEKYKFLGKRKKLIEGFEKVTGYAKYSSDAFDIDALSISPILSPYAHAKIKSIDKNQAFKINGVVDVLTADDLHTKDNVISSRNSSILAKDKVLFYGQPVAVVIGLTPALAQDGADSVIVKYDPLPVVADAISAIKSDAHVIWPHGLPGMSSESSDGHAAIKKTNEIKSEIPSNIHTRNHFKRGDVNNGFNKSHVIIERSYSIPNVHQSYMEPFSCLAVPDSVKQNLTLFTGTQGQFVVRNEVAKLLGMKKNKVKIVPMNLGGGFGAKFGLIEPLVGAVALKLNKPVKLCYTRTEDFSTTTPSPAVFIELKTSADKNGIITAIKGKIILDNGVFAFPIGSIVGALLGGYYKCPNVEIDCYEVITNKSQAGSYRAPGAAQATFALESNIADMAEELGINPLEFRIKNAAETGDLMGNGEKWQDLGLKKCLLMLRDNPVWKNLKCNKDEGIGIAIGGWPCFVSPASAICQVDPDGMIIIHVGSCDITGLNTVLVQVVSEVLCTSSEKINLIQSDTSLAPYAPHSGGSQATNSMSGAVKVASENIKKLLLNQASQHFEIDIHDLDLDEGLVKVKGVPDRQISFAELSELSRTTNGGQGPIISEGRSALEKNSPGFVVHLVKIKIDIETGKILPIKYLAIQDVGFALNPSLVEGQIHGGVVQSIGWGTNEEMLFDSSGELINVSFLNYAIPRADDVPNIDVILLENLSIHGNYGIRGVGEPPITAGLAAIANAVKNAIGIRLTELPLNSERIWMKINEKK